MTKLKSFLFWACILFPVWILLLFTLIALIAEAE